MRIAITGATGFIGRHLVKELVPKGNQLVLLGRDIEKLHSIFNPEAWPMRVIKTDYEQGLEKALEGVEAVVHLAALRVGKDKVLMDYMTSNVVTTDKLLSAAVSGGVKNIIFASSGAVYNPRHNSLPFTEDQDCFPITHYGLSKLICEKLASNYNSNYGMKIKCLRIGQVVGLGDRDGFMLTTMMKRAAAKQTIEVWGKG